MLELQLVYLDVDVFLYINKIFFLLYQIIQFIVNTKNEIDLFFFGNCKLYLVVDFSF